MKHRSDSAEIVAVGGPLLELVGVDVIGEAQRHEMFPLFRAVQTITTRISSIPPPVQSPNQGAADKAGAARNDNRAAVEFEHF